MTRFDLASKPFIITPYSGECNGYLYQGGFLDVGDDKATLAIPASNTTGLSGAERKRQARFENNTKMQAMLALRLVDPYAKVSQYRKSKIKITVANAIDRFKKLYPHDGYEITGNLQRGLVISSTKENSPALVAVRSNEWVLKPEGVVYKSKTELVRIKHKDHTRRSPKEIQAGDLCDLVRRFCGETISRDTPIKAVGNLRDGLTIFVGTSVEPALVAVWDGKDKADKHVVSASVFLGNGPQGDDLTSAEDISEAKVEFGGDQGPAHLEHFTLTAPTRATKRDIRRLAAALRRPCHDLQTITNDPKHNHRSIGKGYGKSGFERECWVINPTTGNLVRLYNIELLAGCVEIDDGVYITTLDALKGLGLKRLELEKEYDGFLIVTTSTSPSDDPRTTKINAHHPKLSPYIVALMEVMKERLIRPRNDESWQMRVQLSDHLKQTNIFDLYKILGPAVWNTGAGHLNIGLPNTWDPIRQEWVVDFELARNASNLLCSELGSVIEMMCFSGPYSNGIAAQVNGEFVLDSRTFIREDMGTAKPCNTHIEDANHFKRIVRTTMTRGKKGADRLPRAVIVHTQGNGDIEATGHGKLRWRFEPSSIPMGRLEYTGVPASNAGNRAKIKAIADYLVGIAILATDEGKDVMNYINELTGISVADLKGNDEATVKEFARYGSKSTRTNALVQRLQKVIEQINIPALTQEKEIALAAIKTLLKDATIYDVAQGNGVLGSAGVHVAKNGYSARQWAIIVDAFEHQEGVFLANSSPDQRLQYAKGQGGFTFELPAVGHPEMARAA